MTTLVFSPYSLLVPETSLLLATASVLARRNQDVLYIRCTGTFPACGRDPKLNGVRPFSQCLKCASESESLRERSNFKSINLTNLVSQDEWLATRTWINQQKEEDLPKIEFRGVELFPLIEPMNQDYVNLEPASLLVRKRNLLISAVLTLRAFSKILSDAAHSIERVLVARDNDVLTSSLSVLAKASGIEVAVFESLSTPGTTVIRSSQFSRPYASTLDLQALTRLRPDVRSWPPEVASEVHGIVEFLLTGGGIAYGDEALS